MTNLTRREVVTGVSVLGAGMVLAATEHAMAAPVHQHPMAAAAPPAGPKYQKLMLSAMDCINTGSICRNHCINLLGMGDTTLKECLQTVLTMLPLCNALGSLASSDSPLLINLAKVCIEACEVCEKECRKHEMHHMECKACADSCARCIKECKALLV